MKRKLLGIVCAIGAALSCAAQTTTTTTTTSTGTLTEYAPGSAFTLKETSGPVSYSYGPEVTYTYKGKTLTPAQVKSVRVGAPVSVGYVTEGEKRVINKVEIDDDFELFDDD